jgi:hypothetical protein
VTEWKGFRQRPKPSDEARGPRGPRGIAHLETDKILSNPEENRFQKWLTKLMQDDLLRSPQGTFAVVPYLPHEVLIIVGRNTVRGCKTFTCTHCDRSTTERLSKDMRHVWPPPEDWGFGFIRDHMVPMKLRRYRWLTLMCPDCGQQAKEEVGEVEVETFKTFIEAKK